ncbi:Vimentin-type intermediate filament-associated coiled-coil protein [Merluccius polli]|uniref:Vimentin-type intermediate filament-associated coiled-coil protein n=1 Tax=Merluccius polli TaxID=89951 RepID=A0AA47NC21_MERPO|nr:Vimentin-type intermediate filament-associated coiled-coil protein [Merluccius polli]
MSSSPSSVQIREANAHLAALHRRVAELEARLRAAEGTVREQAESLIRKDEQVRAATREITETKDREITFLYKKLCKSEETIQHYQQTLKQRDLLVVQLQHRCHLLDSICESRPTLDSMLSLMAEAERMDPVARAAGLNSELNAGVGATTDTGGEEDTRGDERRKFPLCLESRCISMQAEGTTDYSNVISNHKDFSLSEHDADNKEMDDMEFGTTV